MTHLGVSVVSRVVSWKQKKRKSSSYIVGLYRQHQRLYRLYHLDPWLFLGEISTESSSQTSANRHSKVYLR